MSTFDEAGGLKGVFQTRSENFWVVLDNLGLLQVSGAGAAGLLQGQLSCDLSEITENQSRMGAHCDIKGRVQATFRLFLHDGSYYLLLPKMMVPRLRADLQKYAVFYKLSLQDVTAAWQITGLGGSALAELLAADWPGVSLEKDAVACHNQTVTITVPGPVPRLIALTPSAEVPAPNPNFEPASLQYWRLLDIQAGIVTIYPETRGQWTPHHIHYPQSGGVSFTKGCYTGQEVIARMQYLGKLKSRLYRIGFRGETDPCLGAALCDAAQRPQGALLMVASVGGGDWEALACLQTEAASRPLYIEESACETRILFEFGKNSR